MRTIPGSVAEPETGRKGGRDGIAVSQTHTIKIIHQIYSNTYYAFSFLLLLQAERKHECNMLVFIP